MTLCLLPSQHHQDRLHEVPDPACWSESGRIAGTIGGGAVEYRAELMAQDILEKKNPCEHEFRLNRKDVENIGMICGGDVTVFFQYLDHNDPVISEITETATKSYEERKVSGWSAILSNLPAESYSPSYGLIGNADVPSSILSSLSHSHTVIAVMIWFVFRTNRTSELSTYLVVDMFRKKLVPILASVDFHVVLDDRPEFTIDPVLFPDAVETILWF